MKNTIYLIIAIGVLLGFSSCSVDEGERSSITSVTPFTVESVESSSLTVEEGDAGSYTVNFTIDENLKLDGVALITINSESTATQDVDYHLNDTEITLHPWQTEYSFSFDVFSDVLLEGNEKVIFDITTAAEPFFRSEESKSVEVTINDFLTDDLYLIFDWDVPFIFDGEEYTTCPFVDIDVYVLDADGNDLGIYDAATGDCPEQIVVDDSWDDGVYYLASNMWDNATLKGLITGLEYEMTMTAYRQGKIDTSYKPEDNWISDDDDQSHDGNTAFKEVAILEVAGDIFTVSAPDGTILGSGVRAPNKLDIQ